ncbi:MAG: hypothetical protein ACLGGX_10455 [Bdellovibrionia bacterium]
MRKALFLVLVVALGASQSWAKKKDKTPDNPPKSESCPSYGCDNDEDRGQGSDDVDGRGGGYDGGGDDRGGEGGMIGEVFAVRIRMPMSAQVELACTDGDLVKEVITQVNEEGTLVLGDLTLKLRLNKNMVNKENLASVEALRGSDLPIFMVYKSWSPDRAMTHTFVTEVEGVSSECQLRIIPN